MNLYRYCRENRHEEEEDFKIRYEEEKDFKIRHEEEEDFKIRQEKEEDFGSITKLYNTILKSMAFHGVSSFN